MFKLDFELSILCGGFISKEKRERVLTAVRKCVDKNPYYFEDDAPEEFIIDAITNDDLTINTCRNGRDVVWYIADKVECAVYIDTCTELTPDEIEEELM